MIHRVSWLDQPSLVDTMISTARIAGHNPRRPGLRSSAGFAAAANFQLSTAMGLPTQKLWLSPSGAEYCEDGPVPGSSRPGPGIQESAEQG